MANCSYSFYQPSDAAPGPAGELPVQIMNTGRELWSTRAYRWDNERHRFARYDIFQYTLSGEGIFERAIGGRRVRERVGPGRMFIASWDGDFEYYFGGGRAWEFMWITLSGSFADEAARSLREAGPVIEVPADSPPVSILGGLLDRLAGSSGLDGYALSGLGYEFLAQMLKVRASAGASPRDRFLAEARDFVMRNLRTACVASLAGSFGYGEKYFNEYFKARASTTPNRFIVEQRIRYAASLLVNTRKKVAEVARESGFAEENYFSKVFKRHRGSPPAEYRRRNRGLAPVDEIVIL
jgi:AraC-like DNA-binding protein